MYALLNEHKIIWLNLHRSVPLRPDRRAHIIRPHRPYYVRRCGLLLPTE